jgi:hypothetical protein
MPRLSLYHTNKTNDYKFIDRAASEMFHVGGTDIYLHKYLGPSNPDPENATADQPHYSGGVSPTNIQDLLFLENRDRKYDVSIYKIRGVYNVADIDFNLSQFGLFIDNDTVYMTVHINDFIRTVGRKPMSGDVIEVPNLRDEFALNDFDVSLPKYYVISDVGRAAEGFSPTWYPHLYRLKLTKIVDSQQYKDIFDQPAVDSNGDPIRDAQGNLTNQTIRDLLSTHARELEINDAVLRQAEDDAKLSGYETQQFFTLAVDPTTGKPSIITADETDINASNAQLDASRTANRPQRTGYTGYLLGDGVPDNGASFGHGIQFPNAPIKDDFFLRTDFMPTRLFKYDGTRWVKYEDGVRMTMTNNDPTNTDPALARDRQTQKGTFINNKNRTGVGLLKEDFITAQVLTPSITTNITYIDTMYASARMGEGVMPASVTEGPGGFAVITFADPINPGEQVNYKLYRSSTEERQSLSKALRPRADL